MRGYEYLQEIKKELEAGHNQHKKATSILAAFGFVRRRQSSLSVINKALKKLELKCDPQIDEQMPLDGQHIRFLLATGNKKNQKIVQVVEIPVASVESEDEIDTTVTSFKVAELEAAQQHVECIKPSEPLSKAYTVMCLKKYSQLVVAESEKPYAINIKGTISYQSICNALINGSAKNVNQCLDKETPHVNIDDDIGVVIRYLQDHDVVLVIGRDKRLSGVVTAWDLATEFEGLVGPFKWIGEIEGRVKARLDKQLGKEKIVAFLNDVKRPPSEANAEMLTMGSLHLLVENLDNWHKLGLPFERQTFCAELDKAREVRNRLMHFQDPPKPEEIVRLKRFCDVLRRIS